MCQAIVKPANKQVDFKKLDNAQKFNKDGYGVSWFENGHINTFKTLNYNRFKGVLSTLRNVEAIIHLRNATKGKVSFDNIHPFDIPSGVIYHNGTIFSLKGSMLDPLSDTQRLANILSNMKYNKIEDIVPLLEVVAGDTVNRLIFMDKTDGNITIINKELGMTEDDIWYSNDYHKKSCDTFITPLYHKLNKIAAEANEPKYEYSYNKETNTYEKLENIPTYYEDDYLYDIEDDDIEDEVVFVYGTLKRGFHNHDRLLGESTYLGKASTVKKYHMIGEGMSFPYVLEENDIRGYHIEGEVYLVNKKTKDLLDRLEGVPYHYIEKDVDIMYSDTKEIEYAKMYMKTHISKGDRDRTPIKNFIASTPVYLSKMA